MSGEILRQTAMSGDHVRLRAYIKEKANPCSVDNYGLTPLMYAVWNGHVECVKLLLANDIGIDSHGKRNSSISLTSCKGYTALHLCALDSLPWSSSESAFLLLCMGIDHSIKCREGLTAIEIAHQEKNISFVHVYERFMTRAEEILKEIGLKKRELHKDYAYMDKPSYNQDVWQPNFPLPHFVTDSTLRIGMKPRELHVNEVHIQPLVDLGSKLELGISDSLKCLEFSKEQASKNVQRRVKIIKSLQPDWKPLELPQIYVPIDQAVSALDRRVRA